MTATNGSPMKRVAFHTLGCKLNFAESASLGKQLIRDGYRAVSIDDPADLVVINTCSVTENADRECRQIIRRALRRSPDAFVAVVGCYAQLHPEEVAGIHGVDLVLGSESKFDLASHLRGLNARGVPKIAVDAPVRPVHAVAASSSGFGDRTRAFLKVQDGCDYRCSFCTIPLARGNSRSVPPDLVVGEARAIASEGYKEIVLTGVNVGDYGRSDGTNLLALLQSLVGVEGIERIRISSIEPNLLSASLLDFWFAEDKLCKHWHIPLQSGSDRTLRAMRRRYATEQYLRIVSRIRDAFPDAGIGADVIVGFPGETQRDFDDTYTFIADAAISYLHVFSYSERPDTAAESMSNPVPPPLRAERSERLRSLGARKRRSFHARLLNKVVNVLFESPRAVGVMTGLTGEYARVDVAAESDLTNQILSVKIHRYDAERCEGVLMAMTEQTVEQELMVPE